MGKIPYDVDGSVVYIERTSIVKLGLFARRYDQAPYDEIDVPQRFRRFRERHRTRRGADNAYQYSTTWLLEHDASVQESIREKVGKKQVRKNG